MKKRAAGLLAAGLVLGSCWTANAAGHNPYADVPKKDWSYGAVESLIQQGLVTGMTVEDYHNLKRLTRNDLAIYIAQAVSQRENANAHNRDLIYRLVKDYAYELHAIGVDDEFVPEPPQEKKEEQDTRPEIYKKLDRLTLQGWAYIRQNHYESSGASMGRQRTMTHLSENGIDVSLGYTYKLNDNWSFIGSADFYRNLHHEDTTANLNMKSMYLLGHMHGYDIRAGHYDPSNGLGSPFGGAFSFPKFAQKKRDGHFGGKAVSFRRLLNWGKDVFNISCGVDYKIPFRKLEYNGLSGGLTDVSSKREEAE